MIADEGNVSVRPRRLLSPTLSTPTNLNTMKSIVRITLILLGVAVTGIFASCAPEPEYRHVYHHRYYDSSSFSGEQSVHSSGGGAESFEPVSSY
jgi:hypothetical protein